MIQRGVLLVVLAVVAVACGGEAASTTTTSTPSTSAPSTSTTMAPTTSTTGGTSSSSTTTTDVPGTSATSTTLPGDPIDFGPVAGDRLMVIGVSYDDVLNLRRLPGTAFEVIDGIPPDYRDLRALGNTRDLGTSFWIQVDYGGAIGWVHMSFVGYEGSTDDLTSFVIDELGDRPSATTMTEIGMIVASLFVSDEPASDVVKVVDDSVGDLGEVTFDVIGLGDDSVRGVRLHVFGELVTGGFAFRNLEVTYICGRAVTDEGLCV